MRITAATVDAIKIVLFGREHVLMCVTCRAAASRLCDWRQKGQGMCDAPLCDAHATQPAKNKDLCPKHAAEWAARQRQPQMPLLKDSSL